MYKYLIILLLASTQAHADVTGDDLYKSCLSDAVFIDGYIAGLRDKSIADYVYVDESTPQADKSRPHVKLMLRLINDHCIEGETRRQVDALVCRYLSSNPNKRSEYANDLVERVLKDAFPCKR